MQQAPYSIRASLGAIWAAISLIVWMVIYGTGLSIFPLLALPHVWWLSAVIWHVIYTQNHDKQVWKISDVESAKEGNGEKLTDGSAGKRAMVL